MRLHTYLLGLAILAAVLASSAGAYTTHINAPAVIVGKYTGVLTTISLNVTPGTGTISIKGPAIINDTTTMSAQTAVHYAASYLNANLSKYNFTYYIDNTSNVSGPSGGLALTLLAISGLEQRQLAPNFTTTGTINANGTVGEIGGIYDKAQAAKSGGMKFILVPYASNSTYEYLLYYITQQQFDIPVVPVANVSQALTYAFGSGQITSITYNVTSNYYSQSLPQANITCACNISAFGELSNFTLNSTYAEVNLMGGQYGSLKSQILSMLSQYRNISNKGYLYTASDLAFLQYTNTFGVVNANNITKVSTTNLIGNESTYCSSLIAPQMTADNYEYVIGGELRQSWGENYLTFAKTDLNDSETTDDLILAASDVGKSDGWCRAAGEMYYIAAQLGGTPVQTTKAFNANVTLAVDAAGETGSNLYSQSAESEYKQGNYAAALYDSEYAEAFYGKAYNSTENASLISNLSSTNFGAWPTEFALQAQFYMAESRLTSNATQSSSYEASAYNIAGLAARLNSVNRQITDSFDYNVTVSNSTVASSQLSSQVAQLQGEVVQLYWIVLFMLALLFVLLIALLVLLLRKPQARSKGIR